MFKSGMTDFFDETTSGWIFDLPKSMERQEKDKT